MSNLCNVTVIVVPTSISLLTLIFALFCCASSLAIYKPNPDNISENKDQDTIDIAISDEGIGIIPELQERIFERTHRSSYIYITAYTDFCVILLREFISYI
jgi:light-regulated signal transduction histidine kinase (bacteriophytochrome)